MAKLFDIVPDKFFSILASPLKGLYAGAVFAIYQQYLLINFGLPREVVIDCLVQVIEEEMANSSDASLTQALDDEIWENSMLTAATVRDRAGFILRKLEDCGWVAIETYSNYEQYVNLTDYAIKIIDTLDKIKRSYQAEYQGYVYATYTLLYSEEAGKQGHIALEKAYEQTEQLISGLKSLNHNIKRYIELVLKEKKPQEILKIHFEDYKQEILDRSYHRLKTSDNVSKYRPRIISKISEWYENDLWVAEIAAADVRRGRFKAIDEAKQDAYRRLDFIRQSYLNMDNLLEEIDRRNAQYANSSFMQIKYILNSSRDTEGQLLEILKYLAGLLKGSSYGKGSSVPTLMGGLFSIYEQNFLDVASLYTAREISRSHNPEDLVSLAELDPEERAQALARVRERLASNMTREHINEFVLQQLGERESARASQFPLETIEDLVRMIYIAAYSHSRTVDYTAEFDGRRFRVMGADGLLELKDILIKRKVKAGQ